MTRILAFARHSAVDAIIVGLTLAAALELTLTSIAYDRLIVPFYLLVGPALFFRRWFPFAAPVVAFGLLATVVTIDPVATYDMSTVFFLALMATALFAASERRRDALAGGALALGTLAYISHEFGNPPSEYVWITGFFLTAWAFGYAIGTRTRQAAELRERAERAEHERELKAQAAVAEERARIARELHDIVGHSVSVMTVQASAVRRLLRDDQEREREALLSVEETGRAALAEMRRLVGVLRRPEDAPALVPQPSLEHVSKLVEQAREAGLPTELRLEGEPTELPQGLDLTAYRLVQEGLTNALKHANATKAEVIVRYDDGAVELVVRDNGTGEGEGGGSGHGLVGIRERVDVFGGELNAGPRPEGGYELRAILPVTGA